MILTKAGLNTLLGMGTVFAVLIFLALIKVQLPTIVLELTGVVGNANAFLAMLCIGILFQFKLNKVIAIA